MQATNIGMYSEFGFLSLLLISATTAYSSCSSGSSFRLNPAPNPSFRRITGAFADPLLSLERLALQIGNPTSATARSRLDDPCT